jgi:hypothetical protein
VQVQDVEAAQPADQLRHQRRVSRVQQRLQAVHMHTIQCFFVWRSGCPGRKYVDFMAATG